jgi:putative ABC transport system ATP-binding protein
LADEPTGNLDSKSGTTVMDFLKKLHKEENTTIVLVTHDEKVAAKADRTVFLKDGMIVNNLDVDTSKLIEAQLIEEKRKKKIK